MNVNPLLGPKTRIVLWALFWLAGLSIGGAKLGLNGWPWRFGTDALEPYLLSNENAWYHSATQIEKLRSLSPATQRFILIGGSACMEAITSDVDIENRLRLITGVTTEFASVCSSHTTFSDVAKIVDRIGHNGDTILVPVEPSQFHRELDAQLEHHGKTRFVPKYYFLPVPESLKVVLKEQGLSLPFGYDILNYIKVAPDDLSNSVRNARLTKKKKLTFQRHPNKKRSSEKEQKNYEFSLKIPDPDVIALNTALLRTVIEIAQKYGGRVVFVEQPNAEPYRANIAAGFPSYDTIISGLVEKYGIEYIDLRHADSWPRGDFWDIHHMTPEGREKFTPMLAASLAKLIQDRASQ